MIKRNWRKIFSAITITIDTFVIIVSAVTAYYLRQLFPNVPEIDISVFAWIVLYFWFMLIFIATMLGLYRSAFRINIRRQYFLAGKAYIYSILIILASLYFIQVQHSELPRRFIILLITTLPIYFLLGRAILNRLNNYMHQKGYGVHKVLILDGYNSGKEIIGRIRENLELGYVVKGTIADNEASKNHQFKCDNTVLPVFHISELEKVVEQENIHSIFLSSPTFLSRGHESVLELCKAKNVRLKILSQETENVLRLSRIYDVAGITLYSPDGNHKSIIKSKVKRLLDIFGSLFFIILLSPIFVIAAFCILIESGRPIIFKQKRAVNNDGRCFNFYKFRSMIKNADELKDSLLPFNEANGALFKMKNDPRMTKIGRILRKLSIDELPQLFNVLKGDMSLVGPRPIPISDLEKLSEEPQYWRALSERGKLKPGITGLWQISGRSHVGFREMLLMDLYYIENQSLLFDLEILFATIPVVIMGRGAY